MKHDFSRVPHCNIPRSVFDRSTGWKATFGANELIPFLIDEVLPGDSYKVNTTMLLRFNDLIHPFMDNMFIDTFYFFVPYRLVWDNWERFCGAQDNPGDTTDYVVPQVEVPKGRFVADDLFGYLVAPIKNQLQSNTLKINSLVLRAYNFIWNEWFRDENLQNSVVVNTADAGDADTDFKLLKRGKRHDYFTSCLPWPQKGPAVLLPLGVTAPVVSNSGTVSTEYLTPLYAKNANGTPLTPAAEASSLGFASGSSGGLVGRFGVGGTTVYGAPYFNLQADLSQATSATINQLREAFAVQRLYEKDARGGTRYFEVLQSQFGVTNPDLRLQRPEYLGGSSQRINVTAVPQTSASVENSSQANLAGYSVTGAGSGFVKSFAEYGVVIGLVSIRADLTYQQGLEKLWTRRTRLDYYWPSLAFLGEQAVLNKEIYCDGTAGDDEVFGYQERWAEYRYKPSRIVGYLNSVSASTMDVWHLSQKFDSRPVLNDEFIEEDVPVARVKAVKNLPAFLMDAYISLKTARPMPTYSVPGLIDHF